MIDAFEHLNGWKWLIISAVIVFGRWLYYYREVRFIIDIEKTYASFFHEYAQLPRKNAHILDPKHPALSKLTKLRKRKSRYIELVKRTGMDDNIMTTEVMSGRSYEVHHKVSNLIDEANPRYLSSVMDSFDNIKGYYEDRANESFDIFYWVKLVPRLPKVITQAVISAFKGH